MRPAASVSPGVRSPELPWLLPAHLVGERSGRHRRSVRDWLVDVTAFVLSVLLAVYSVISGYDSFVNASPSGQPIARWLAVINLVGGVLGCAAVWATALANFAP